MIGLSRSRKNLEFSCRPDELDLAKYSDCCMLCISRTGKGNLHLLHFMTSLKINVSDGAYIILLMIGILPRRETKVFDKQSYFNLIVYSDFESEGLQIACTIKNSQEIRSHHEVYQVHIGRHVSHVPLSKMPFSTSSCILSHHAFHAHEKEQEHHIRYWRLTNSAYLAAVQPAMATARRTATA